MERTRLKKVPDGVVLQVGGHALGGRMPPVPTYVMECDFEAHNGVGEVIFTQKREEAKHFVDGSAALDFYRTQSKTVPLRPDGKPNRPLTAYHMILLKDGSAPM
jgi:hypothetical protein